MSLKRLLSQKMQLVMVRHGTSTWNQENRFTGWWDVPLASEGIEEAVSAGKLLKEANFDFDVVYTSVLRRAVTTYNIICDEINSHHVPVIKSWRLNERHYGGLTGLNKAETTEKHGEAKVKIWRRSYDIPPPPMEENDQRAPRNDPKYKYVAKQVLPLTESLKDTQARALPFFYDHIVTDMLQGKNVLVVAHGNSLRSIVKVLDNISDDDITSLNIPTGIPLVYDFDKDFKVLNKQYLGNQEEIQKKIDAVSKQASKKP